MPVFTPGSREYERATSPHNASARQHPRAVLTATSADEVAAAILWSADRELRVVPQATGHGAAGELGDDVALLDTSGLDRIDIDGERRRARVGAGARWGAVDAEAEKVGLLAMAGAAPGVSVSGFTFGGGAGWLTRPYGLAAGSLVAVDYVDGLGMLRRAAEDAEDEIDRSALWAFRGGGGVGVATGLEFALERVDDLWAGYLLWPVEALGAVVGAWADALPQFGPALTTSIAVLHAPPAPPIPDRLQGAKVVHLAVASCAGEDQAAALRSALRRAPTPVADTWGRADARRLGGIHLDPPAPVPAFGMARWLDDATPQFASAILSVAADTPAQMTEIRNVGNAAAARPGAMSTVPGTFMLHAVGDDSGGGRPRLEAAFATVRRAAAPADAGLAVGSWTDGRTAVPEALPPDVRQRLTAIRAKVDPHGRIAPTKFTNAADSTAVAP